jgi:hypothetical protein
MDALAVIVTLAYTLWTLYEVGLCLKRDGLRNIHQAGTRP